MIWWERSWQATGRPPLSDGYKAPRWAWWIATGLGSGRLRPAPGTWGSLAGLLAWCLLTLLGPLPFSRWCALHPDHPQLWLFRLLMELPFLLAIAALTWAALRASDCVARETGLDDPGFIVADEWVGIWVTLWPVRWTLTLGFSQVASPGGALALAAILGIPFLVFRVLDIWKPWPVHQLQDLPMGQGIVADDLVAGLYAIPLVLLLVPAVLTWLQRVPN